MTFRTFDSLAEGRSFRTADARMRDSAGAFLASELERLDTTLHEPIYAVTWGRDIDLREDVVLGDEFSAFQNALFASPGGINPTGKAWIGKTSTEITGIQVDVAKSINPLHAWGMELGYTLLELSSSQLTNKSIDSTKYDGMQIKYQMDVDEMVYVGDAGVSAYGLTNSPLVPATNVVNGAGGLPQWNKKTAAEILGDVNSLLSSVWAASGWAYTPSKVLLPPLQFSYINATVNGAIGNLSILEYLKTNSLSNANNGRPLEIAPVKWLTGRGAGGTDRMVAYTQDKSRVRFPLVPLQQMPGGVQYRGIHFLQYYVAKLGVVEITQTEMMGYRDGI